MRSPSLPIRLRARSLVLPLLPLSAFAPAAAAQEVAWSFRYNRSAEYSSQRPVATHATPDGGVVSVQFARRGAEADVLVVKFSANGDRVWRFDRRADTGPANSFLQERTIASGVAPDGGTYVASHDQGQGFLARIDADGAVAWELDVLPLPGSNTVAPVALDFAPNGDVVLVSSAFYGTVPRFSVARFTPGGSPVFREEAADPARVGHPLGVDVGPTGSTVVFGMSDAPVFTHVPTVSVFEGSGQPRWTQAFTIFPLGAREEVRWGVIDGQDRVTVMIDENDVPFGEWSQEVAAFDAQGQSLWFSITSSANGDPDLRSLQLKSDGSVVLAGRTAADEAWVEQRDTAGSVQWSGVPSIAIGAVGLVLDTVPQGDDVVVHGSAGSCRFVTRFDGTGAEVRSFCDQSGALETALASLVVDPRGNYLVHDLSAPLSGVDVTKLLDGDPVGSAFCSPAAANSTGAAGSLVAFGSGEAQRDNLTLLANGLPTSTFVLFLASRTAGFVPNVGGGDGTLCLGGSIGRYVAPGQIRRSGLQGFASLQLDLDEVPQPTGLVQVTAGSTWRWQAWYRDANPAPTSNLTDAVEVQWQ